MSERRNYGLGTVDQPRRGVFRARGPRDANGKRPTLGYTSTEEEAHKLLEGVAILKAEAGLDAGASMTLAGYGPRFLDGREAAGVRDIANERSRWRLHIATAPFANWPMGNVEPSDVQEWLDGLAQKMASDVRITDPKRIARMKKAKTKIVYRRKPRKLGAQTRKHCRNLLSQAYEQAIKEGHCRANPVADIAPPIVAKPSFDYLHIDEQNAIEHCEAIDEADRLRAMFAWGTGIRQNDQWCMKLSDLRLDQPDPDMLILCHKNGPRKPPKRIRVQLFGVALRAIRRWLEILPSYCPKKNTLGLVWPLPSGARRQKCKSYGWDRMLKAAGIARHVTWHELRDTCASSLLMGWWGRRWTMPEVQAMLAHSSIEVTERYAHLAPSALAQAARETEGAAAEIGPQIGPRPKASKSNSSTISRRATQNSNLRPSAPEAQVESNIYANLSDMVGQLWANLEAQAKAVIVAEATGDAAFARRALDLALEALRLARASEVPGYNRESA